MLQMVKDNYKGVACDGDGRRKPQRVCKCYKRKTINVAGL